MNKIGGIPVKKKRKKLTSNFLDKSEYITYDRNTGT